MSLALSPNPRTSGLMSFGKMLAEGCLFSAAALNPVRGRAWWQNWWEPCAQCECHQHRLRIGRQGDGGKWLCATGKHDLVASVGSNNEFSYEYDMHKRFNSTVEVYDHTSRPPSGSVPWLTFHKQALTRHRLREIAAKRPSVLKIDCEGCEYDVFDAENLMALRAAHTQIQIEVHFQPNKTARLWHLFEEAGYYAAHKEPNIQYSRCVELLLVPWPPEAVPWPPEELRVDQNKQIVHHEMNGGRKVEKRHPGIVYNTCSNEHI